MADLKQIQFKRSNTAGKRPLPADIAEGELAINIKDATLFTKNADGAIIDLGFAKGGNINGNVVQIGNYTQTGDYTTSGDINAKTITLSAGVISNGDVLAQRGVIRTRANDTSNAHLWFEGNEIGSDVNYERGVLYARPNTATEGTISLRVMNGFDNNNSQALFSFRGNGDFDVPRDVTATRDFTGQRTRLSIESIAPTMNASRLYTRDRQWGQFGAQHDEGYGWNDLVNYTEGDNGALKLNYVYKGRAMASGTIWHQLIDERSNAEWALYTGGGPSNKMFSVFSRGGLGHGKFTGSLMVGGTANDISALGDNSISFGENNTGLRRTSTGNLDIIASGGMAFRFSSTEAINRSYNRLHVQHSDASGNAINPPGNNAQLQIDTSGDSNNAGGNGLTLIGYYTMGGEYNHYFRGKGEAVFNMGRGVNITNSLTVGGSVNPGNYSNFDSRYQNLFQLGANVNLDTLTGDSQLGEWAQHANVNTSLALNYPEAQAGHLTITSGAGVQQTYRVYNSSRMYLRSKYSTSAWTPWDRVVTDDYLAQGINGSIVSNGSITSNSSIISKTADGFRIAYGSYGFFIRNDGGSTYFMLTNRNDQMGTWNGLRPLTISNSTGQVSVGTPLVVTHASGINVTSTAGNAISWGNAGACVANDGNLKGSCWKAFGGGDWANAALNWVNAQNVSKSGDTMTGSLQAAGLTSTGDIALVRNARRHIRFNDNRGADAYIYKDAGANPLRVNLGLDGGDWQFQVGGTFYASGNGDFNDVRIRSDIRLKTNLVKIKSAIDKVEQLNGYIYDKKQTISDTEYTSNEAGLIAQELEKVLPQAVSELEDGTKTISSSATIALLIESIKELSARIKELESK